jgi:hypothetical protein
VYSAESQQTSRRNISPPSSRSNNASKRECRWQADYAESQPAFRWMEAICPRRQWCSNRRYENLKPCHDLLDRIVPKATVCCFLRESSTYVCWTGMQKKQTAWFESASELYRPSDRRLLAKLVSTFTDATWSA